ncbi:MULTISPECIES: ANTAR domain-containing protein [Rhodococcus]|uniref:ANTAR domain-containing protein n=1 Tax=Rhodococcus TaxID=1827 RepID=UPI001356D9DE|nr:MULTISPECIES: ANTAR domain-containing protein [Rhodococcus]KAF0963838.1 hypothetical protein MLGJGCBP_03024 [Rhodococcus sp. T7]QQZ18234.1 ANTAR domain-containing protein [Rhodococcus sp. 21391]UOT08163.1 ANTAR domain-containing protein [Rhodococcus opacus]
MAENDTARLFPEPTPLARWRRRDGRELLATAKGVLIAGRGYSDAQAFDELLDVAHRHHLTVLGAARALVDLAGPPRQNRPRLDATRFDEWATLLAQLPPRRHAG